MYFVRVFNSDEVIFLVIQIMFVLSSSFTRSALGGLFILFVISREKDLQLLQLLRSQQSVESVRAISSPQSVVNAKPVKLGKRVKAAKAVEVNKTAKRGKAKVEVPSNPKQKSPVSPVVVKEPEALKVAKPAEVMPANMEVKKEKEKKVKKVKKSEKKDVKEEKKVEEVKVDEVKDEKENVKDEKVEEVKEVNDEKKEVKDEKKVEEVEEEKEEKEEEKEEVNNETGKENKEEAPVWVEGEDISCRDVESSVSIATISSTSLPTNYCLVEPTASVRFLVFHMVSELTEEECFLVTSNTEVLEGGEKMTMNNGSSRCWPLHRVNGEFTTKVCVNEHAMESICKEILLTYRYAIRVTRKYSVKWFFSEWHSQYVNLAGQPSLERTVVLELDQVKFKSYSSIVPKDKDCEKAQEEAMASSPKSGVLSSPKSGVLSSPEVCYSQEEVKEEGVDLSAASLDSDYGESEIKLTPMKGKKGKKSKSKKSRTLRILTLPGEENWNKEGIAFGTSLDETHPMESSHPTIPEAHQVNSPVPPMSYSQPVMYPSFYQPMMMVVGPSGQPMMVSPYPQNPFFMYTAQNGCFIPEENQDSQ